MQADVAVVGRGPAGTAAATVLHHRGLSVVMVDRDVPRPLLAESLPPGAAPLLRELGLWNDFLACGQRPSYGNRSSWGSAGRAETDFIRSAHGNGWHLDGRAFHQLLRDTLDSRDIQVLSGRRMLACGSGGERRWRLTMSNGGGQEQLEVDFLIDASGRSRQVARMLGVGRLSYDRLMGMIGMLEIRPGADDPDSRTEIEAGRDGWWFTSPLPDGRRVAGYMTDSDGETGRTARDREGWMALLNETIHLRERVARHSYTLQGSIHRIAANSSRLERVAGDGWCAAGDAAAAFDPLSSQGIMTALDSGRRAASVVLSGQGGAAGYEEYMRDLYARYLALWLTYYAEESRWPDQPFWRRRHRALQDALEGQEDGA